LSEGIVMGARVLDGHGLTIGDRSAVTTYRMPGYPLFAALAGWVFRADPKDLVAMGVSTVYAHLTFFAPALGSLGYALPAVVPIGTAAVVLAVIGWFPLWIDQTQNDTIVLACGLVVTASLCLYLARRRATDAVPLAHHLLVHGAFGLWMLVR